MKATKSYLKQLFRETLAEMDRTADFYQLPRSSIEERIINKAKKILEAIDVEAAQNLRMRALGSLDLFCLSSMANGQIEGPRTAERLTKKAKQAESLFLMQDKLGNSKAAMKQKRRAEDLREEARKLQEATCTTLIRRVKR